MSMRSGLETVLPGRPARLPFVGLATTHREQSRTRPDVRRPTQTAGAPGLPRKVRSARQSVPRCPGESLDRVPSSTVSACAANGADLSRDRGAAARGGSFHEGVDGPQHTSPFGAGEPSRVGRIFSHGFADDETLRFSQTRRDGPKSPGGLIIEDERKFGHTSAILPYCALAARGSRLAAPGSRFK